jgi:hypothetical protein
LVTKIHQLKPYLFADRCETDNVGSRCAWQPSFRPEGQSELEIQAVRCELEQTDGTSILREAREATGQVYF